MKSYEMLDRIIDDAAGELRRHMSSPEQASRLDGALEGLEACRGLIPSDLKELMQASEQAMLTARQQDPEHYWWYRWYALQVEWVCNCMSAWLMQHDLPVIVQPTIRGALNVARIQGDL